MSLQIVQVVLCSVVAFLGGGAIAWRLLGRGRGGKCPTLAREVTDRVHNRCSAYQLLEERINTVIADFDRRESEMRAEWSAPAPAYEAPAYEAPGYEAPAYEAPVYEPPVYEEPIVATAPAAFPLESTAFPTPSSTGAEALAWMDACDAPGESAPYSTFDTSQASATPATDQIVSDEGWAADTEGVVDQFANRLQILQREKSAELDRQRTWVASLENRIQALETAVQSLVEASRAVPDTTTEALRTLAERLARTESEVARVRVTPAPRVAPPQQQAPPAPRTVVPERRVAAKAVTATAPTPSLDDLPGPIGSRRTAPAQGSSSEISQLMRNLELAKDETEIYRRKLREQEGHFSAAYSMLERVRPLVDALESELSANIRGGRG